MPTDTEVLRRIGEAFAYPTHRVIIAEAADEIDLLRVELKKVKAISKSRKNKKEVAVTAREDHRRGLEYWRERAMNAETKLTGTDA